MVYGNWTPPTEVGSTIPAEAKHAVSVALPTWAANVAYEEGEDWVTSKMRSGYPRFCIHFKIQELASMLEDTYGRDNESVMIFPNQRVAQRCRDFIKARADGAAVRILQLTTPKQPEFVQASISAVFFPKDLFPIAKQYWQHTGEGVSSRLAEYFLEHNAGPGVQGDIDQSAYVEERFGRNLDVSRADEAKHALRTRIASHLSQYGTPFNAADIFLFPTGMTAIFTAHRLCLGSRSSAEKGLKSICFGFPYTDTLKVLEKWGPGAVFFPRGTEQELDELESRLEAGEKFSALFCEFPSNPLLKSPNLKRIRELANKYDFLVVVDETVGNMSNIYVMPYVDIVVSSLTKVFSGDCNVMAGALFLNPKGRHVDELKATLAAEYVDAFWAEDAIYLERNSRDFVARSHLTNENAEAVVELLLKSPLVKEVYYPKTSDTRPNFDFVKNKDGGYGGLLAIVFKEPAVGMAFFDAINIAKGPSLGTNFTLACPYTIIAHYAELDFVESCGVDRHLVRISIGLEETEELLERFRKGLETAKTKGSHQDSA